MTNIPPIQPQINVPQPVMMPTSQPVPKGNGMAKASFILGVCSLIPLLGLLTGLLALVLGIIALVKKTSKTWMAVTGMVMAVIFPIILSILLSIVVANVEQVKKSNREYAHQRDCSTNMSTLAKSIGLYEAAYDSFPADVDVLLKNGYGTENVLRCPASGHGKGTRDYIYVCPSNDPYQHLSTNMIVACDIGKWHSNGGRAILRYDCAVWFCRTDAYFQAELAKPENAKFAAALKRAEAAINNGK